VKVESTWLMTKMARKFEWTNEKTEMLIDGYESRPCLWDTTCQDFHDRELKRKARDELATALAATGTTVRVYFSGTGGLHN